MPCISFWRSGYVSLLGILWRDSMQIVDFVAMTIYTLKGAVLNGCAGALI